MINDLIKLLKNWLFTCSFPWRCRIWNKFNIFSWSNCWCWS